MSPEETLYRDYLVEWLKWKRYTIRPQSLVSTESCIRRYVDPLLGHLSMSELNPVVLQNLVNTLKDKGLANASVRRIFSTVHSSLNEAERMQVIPKNPASLVMLPQIRRRQLQVWDMTQVQEFLQLASRNPYTYIAFHLALLTGMRQGEILGLRWLT